MSSGESFKRQMPAAEKLNSYKISEPNQKIRTDASWKVLNKNIPGELYL